MHIVHHAHLPHLNQGGELRIAAVDRARGIHGFEVSLRTLQAGAHTPAQQHGGELAVVAMGGAGKLLIDGGPQRFNGPCTLVIPRHTPFEIANHGTTPLQLVWIYTEVPAAT